MPAPPEAGGRTDEEGDEEDEERDGHRVAEVGLAHLVAEVASPAGANLAVGAERARPVGDRERGGRVPRVGPVVRAPGGGYK